MLDFSQSKILQTTLQNVDDISARLDKNTFIEKARNSFKNGIDNYDIAEDEKAKLIAQYEAQVSLGLISEIIRLAKDLIITDAQMQETDANIELKKQQKLSMIAEDTIKSNQSEKDIAIKTQQELITKEQVSGEKVRTALGLNQIVSEQYRHRDLLVGVNLKIASNEVTKQQAKFEEARRYIALQSNNQNTYMKKADYEVQQLQAIAQDDQITISAEQIQSVKNTINAIPTDKVVYNSEVNISNISVTNNTISIPTVTELKV